MGGQPFYANPLNKVFYPPQYLVVLLSPILHLNLLLWLHLILAGLGMWYAARSCGISDMAAKVIGVTYVLTPRLMAAAGAGHLDVVYAMAWLPCVVGIARYAVSYSKHGLLRRALTSGIVIALSIHADVRISAFSLSLAGLLLLIPLPGSSETAVRRDYRAILLALVIATVLTAPMWGSLLYFAPQLSRAGLTAAEAAAESISGLQLLAFFIPRPPGSHEQILYVGWFILLAAGSAIIAAVRSEISRAGANKGHKGLHSITVLIGTRQFQAPKLWVIGLLLAVVIFCAFYVVGSNGILWTTLVEIFPTLLWWRVPPRIWIVAVFALLLLAGYGLSRIRSAPLLVVVAALIIAESLYTDATRITFQDRAVWLDRYAPIAQAIRADGGRKFYSPTYSIPTQATAYYDLQDAGGVDPFQFSAYIPIFERATGTRTQGYSITLPSFDAEPNQANRSTVPDAKALSALGVTHVVSAFAMNVPGLTLLTTIDGTTIYRVTP